MIPQSWVHVFVGIKQCLEEAEQQAEAVVMFLLLLLQLSSQLQFVSFSFVFFLISLSLSAPFLKPLSSHFPNYPNIYSIPSLSSDQFTYKNFNIHSASILSEAISMWIQFSTESLFIRYSNNYVKRITRERIEKGSRERIEIERKETKGN